MWLLFFIYVVLILYVVAVFIYVVLILYVVAVCLIQSTMVKQLIVTGVLGALMMSEPFVAPWQKLKGKYRLKYGRKSRFISPYSWVRLHSNMVEKSRFITLYGLVRLH